MLLRLPRVVVVVLVELGAVAPGNFRKGREAETKKKERQKRERERNVMLVVLVHQGEKSETRVMRLNKIIMVIFFKIL